MPDEKQNAHRRNYESEAGESLTAGELDAHVRQMVALLAAALSVKNPPLRFVVLGVSGLERSLGGTLPPGEMAIVLAEKLSEIAGAPAEGRVVIESLPRRTVQ